MPRQKLNVLLLRERALPDLARALRRPDDLELHALDIDGASRSLLAFRVSPGAEPDWVEALRSTVAPDLPGKHSQSQAAVLLLETARHDGGLVGFACLFGPAARTLLEPNCWVPQWGLRAALNLMHQTQGPELLRRVDTKTVTDNPVQSAVQSARPDAIERFDIDAYRDLLRSVEGRAGNPERWGRTLRGSDALRVTVSSFADLPADCRALDAAASEDHYKEHFEWIDHVRAIVDPTRVAELESELAQRLRADDHGFAFGPPQLLEESAFRYRYGHKLWDELDIESWRGRLRELPSRDDDQLDQLQTLTSAHLKHRRVKAVDDHQEQHAWSLLECLEGELELRGETYLLTGGAWYAVQPEFRHGLLTELADRLRQAHPTQLPPTTREEHEGDYNERVATADRSYLLMDKKNIHVKGRGSPVELCDLLTADQRLIHVKRKLRSASLSHLFAQGAVSMGLLLEDVDFRRAARSRVQDAALDATQPPDPFVQPLRTPHERDGWRVVYAIAADFQGRTVLEALPFFSLVNLHRTTRELQRRQVEVELVGIPV